MANAPHPISNGELKIWIEGQFELVKERQEFTNKELGTVRTRLHDYSNDVARQLAKHEGELTGLKAWRASLVAVKAAYSVGGALAGGVIAIALELFKVIRP